MEFEFEKLDLDGAMHIKNFYSTDNRGKFTKCYEKDIYSKAGIEFNVHETFISVSNKNVIRGLHFQLSKPQAKIVSVVQGRLWDVIVDLRPDSHTFRKWRGIELSEDLHNAIYIPKGFAHGFVSLEDHTVMLYQCDGEYDKKSDTGIKFDDLDIGITWPINTQNVICSERDLNLMSFKEYLDNPMII